MSRGIGCRRCLDPALMWLWCRPAATAPVGPLAWGHPYITDTALKRQKDKKKKKKKKRERENTFAQSVAACHIPETLLVF